MSKELLNTKKNVYDLNSQLQDSPLVIQNFGNASSRLNNSFVIKPIWSNS